MCGLVSIFRYGADAPAIDPGELKRCTDAMAARGPDAEGAWRSDDGRVELGHRRLSIIDLHDSANQPLRAPSQQLAIVFNGEIYNHRQLRAELQHGWAFQTQSDTEVILAAYAQDPDGFVGRLRGMFAFVIWDGRRGELFAARDAYGIKPLYMARRSGTLRLASQVRALAAGGAVSREIDAQAAYGYYCWGSVPEPRTIYRDVEAFPPGHVLRVRQGQAPQLTRFASIESLFLQSPSEHVADTAGTLADALHGSVQDHLVADVQVGVFLSAGIDSTLLASQVAELSSSPPVAVTLGFEEFRGTERDETVLASEVARALKLDHHVYWLGADEFLQDLEHALSAMDQPSIDGINTYFVSKAAKAAGLKTVLSGLGGDELFGGYGSFSELPRWLRMRKRLPDLPLLPGALAAAVHQGRRLPAVRKRLPAKLAGVLQAEANAGGMYALRRGLFLPREAAALTRERFGSGAFEAMPAMAHQSWQPDADTELGYRSIAAMESTYYMRNQLLRDSDWASMAHSLELRVPLVDHHLAKAVIPVLAGLPHVDKGLLRGRRNYAFHDKIYNRPKTGFHTPVDRWILDAGILDARHSEGRPSRDWAKYVFDRYVGR